MISTLPKNLKCKLEDIRFTAKAYISAPVNDKGERQLPEDTIEELDETPWYECQGWGCAEIFYSWEEVQEHLEEQANK